MLLLHRILMPRWWDIPECTSGFIIRAMFWPVQSLVLVRLFSVIKHKNGLIIEIEEIISKPNENLIVNKYIKLLKMKNLLSIICITVLFSSGNLSAQSGYKVVNQIHLEGDGGWDYLSVDEAAGRLYV